MKINEVVKIVPGTCECLSFSVVYVEKGLIKEQGWKATEEVFKKARRDNGYLIKNAEMAGLGKPETKRGCKACLFGLEQGENCFCKKYLQNRNVDFEKAIPEKYALGEWVVNNGCPFFVGDAK